MWEQHDLAKLSQAGVKRRFLFEDVEAGAGESAVQQGADERGFIHDRPARGIDQECCWFHKAELVGTDQMMGAGRERHMEADKISFT